MNERRLVKALLVVMLVPAISGCRRDPVVEWLEHSKENAKAKGFRDVEERCELCLSKWQNRTLDPEPVLVLVSLGRVVARGMNLLFEAFDEDKDVIGLGIKEEYTDANGLKTLLTEEYPAFVHRMTSDVMPLRFCDVQIRYAGQRKDAQRWEQYVNGEGIDVSSLRSTERWIETLPTVWISIPEPNKVDVYVYVYDRAGHKSEPLRLPTPTPYIPTREELFWRKVRMDRQRSLEKVP